MNEYKKLDFLESRDSFESFYEDAVLSEEDKHRILIASQVQLQSMQIV